MSILLKNEYYVIQLFILDISVIAPHINFEWQPLMKGNSIKMEW